MYQPNIKDPRVLRRITRAHGYVINVFSEKTELSKSRKALDKQFGQYQDPLGKFLKDTLLICTDEHYSHNAKLSKKYILNKDGVNYTRNLLLDNIDSIASPFTPPERKHLLSANLSTRTKLIDEFVVIKLAEQEYKLELETKDFVYDDISNRLWHGIQSMRSKYKKKLLNKYGMKYHYDIKACAPTLLYQHAQHLGMDEYLLSINDYLKNRTQWRDRLTVEGELLEEFGYGHKTSKILINALFCGARLGHSTEFALSQLLNNDYARIEWIKQDDDISALRKDIRSLWESIKPFMNRVQKMYPDGSKRMLAITSKQKWSVYFDLERQVLNAARRYLKKTNNNCFLEHDGWCTEKEIDVIDMQRYVLEITGFKIEVDSEVSETENH